MSLHTPLCDLLGVKRPIMLAGMGGVSYAELAAAVTNAGGYGVLGMAGRGPRLASSAHCCDDRPCHFHGTGQMPCCGNERLPD
jgi:NAD(P)H-dependent flavin oxidoreductase YrpB (nitropropane dioxygenase family)